MVHYRSFRNDDPPHLADIWNAAFTSRGAVRLRHSSPLESYVFAKPYFDPAGLVVAVEEGQRLGFAHAGFRSDAEERRLCTKAGVLCAIGVRPSHRRCGIGSALLQHCEEYLRSRGAETLYAGPMRPLDPFYFGLYGGSELPGFLETDTSAKPFLLRRGYQIHDTSLVFHRSLVQPLDIPDGRFADLRRRYEVCVAPRSGARSWWQECVHGPVELIEFRLEEKVTGRVAARVFVWDMEGFSWRWSQPSVGIVDLTVLPELRRQGLAKFLLAQLLKYLQDQFFSLVEVQTMQANEPAVHLYRALGFQQVDSSHIYRRVQGA